MQAYLTLLPKKKEVQESCGRPNHIPLEKR